MRLNDPELVRREYATETGLAARRDAQRRYLEGPDALEVVFEKIVAARPRRLLEVGCGMGEFAERLTRESGAAVVATDLSPRMVELTAHGGVEARVADVQALPFDDGEFDCAVAIAMLYHVDDLDRALRELARVLEPGGRLVALTVGEGHMGEVWDLVGYERPEKPFRRENGEEHLRRHFAAVERRDVDAVLAFPDEAAVHGYVEATFFGEAVPRPLPPVAGSFRASVCATVFVATR